MATETVWQLSSILNNWRNCWAESANALSILVVLFLMLSTTMVKLT